MDPNQQQPPVNEEPAPTSFDVPAEAAPVESTPVSEYNSTSTVDAQPTPSTPVYAAPVAADPGHGLGIASLIVSLVGFGLIGLILGIIGLKKSKTAGHGNGLALAGIIIGVLNIVVTILIIGGVAYGVVQLAAQCNDLGSGVHTLSSGATINCGS